MKMQRKKVTEGFLQMLNNVIIINVNSKKKSNTLLI